MTARVRVGDRVNFLPVRGCNVWYLGTVARVHSDTVTVAYTGVSGAELKSDVPREDVKHYEGAPA